MGCMTSAQRVAMEPSSMSWRDSIRKEETVLAAIARLDDEIASSEKTNPAARLAVVTAEIDSLQQEINTFDDVTSGDISKDSYAKTIHQLFVNLDLYRRPILATDNEDFIANVNRKEMRRLELSWLRQRLKELQKERQVLHAQILRTKSLYAQLHHVLDSVWGNMLRPGTQLEATLGRARALRDALAGVSARLRAAAEYAHAAVRKIEDGMPAWKLTSIGKKGWERTSACADACSLFVEARCLERGARRVLSASAAPRASRSMRLALDYAFTDALHDHKYQRATEVFLQFKQAIIQLIGSIHKNSSEVILRKWRCLSIQKRMQVQAQAQKKDVKPPPKAPPEIEMFINGTPVKVPAHFTIIQAVRKVGLTLPTFCYHDQLAIAGNCRMCLVQLEGAPKLQIACAMPVMKGMKVRTNSPETLRAQEGVLELILANHPLDCPICDQGGECDLQDLSMKFGNDRGRFVDIHFQGKRAQENKDLGPLIRTEMTRCIQCTRCIRFASQVCGLEVLGTTGRGNDMLVGTYVDKMFLSELSGNIIDLCPVGALTAIPYMFKARPWELTRTNSIDVTDACGTNISINHRFEKVLRVLPREHLDVNTEWLSDKGRWAIDSLDIQRLVIPMCRNFANVLVATDWCCALAKVTDLIFKCNPACVFAVAGPYCNAETLVAAKDLLNGLGSEHTYVEREINYLPSSTDLRAGYALNIRMKDIAKADKILLVGTNPRFEASILNTWIRQAYLFNECDIYYIGGETEFNYPVRHLGKNIEVLDEITDFTKAKNPLIFVGIAQLEKPGAGKMMIALKAFADQCKAKAENWKVLHVIPREASWAAALEIGWKPGALSAICCTRPALVLSFGADSIFYKCPPTFNVVYIGFQGDKGAQCAQVVLPGSAYTESGGVYLNMEGRAQKAMPAITPPGQARYDWKIVRALADFCKVTLPYDNEGLLMKRLAAISPNLVNFDKFQEKLFSDLVIPTCTNDTTSIDLSVDMRSLEDYYCSDVFTYNSPTMVKAKIAAAEFQQLPYNKI